MPVPALLVAFIGFLLFSVLPAAKDIKIVTRHFLRPNRIPSPNISETCDGDLKCGRASDWRPQLFVPIRVFQPGRGG